MASNLLETDINDILYATLSEPTDDLLVINPTSQTVEALVEVASEYSGRLPTMRLIADDTALKTTFGDFLIASRAADLIDNGQLSIRTLEDDTANSLLVADESVRAIVTAGDRVAALSTEDAGFVESARTAYDAHWESASAFRLRTPPITRVRETLERDIGEATRSDFDAVLASLETARGNGDGLDEVTISLLVAAKNEILLYDISKWGEDVGIASKATFSRTKTRLEDKGLIATEKVPIDVGRPRLRLQLGNEQLVHASADDLAAAAEPLLA